MLLSFLPAAWPLLSLIDQQRPGRFMDTFGGVASSYTPFGGGQYEGQTQDLGVISTISLLKEGHPNTNEGRCGLLIRPGGQ